MIDFQTCHYEARQQEKSNNPHRRVIYSSRAWTAASVDMLPSNVDHIDLLEFTVKGGTAKFVDYRAFRSRHTEHFIAVQDSVARYSGVYVLYTLFLVYSESIYFQLG